MIPPQLHNPNFRFIKIRPDNKKAPLEQGWTETTNYAYDDQTILDWIREGNNYGVATGFGDLIVIDSDHEELKKIVEREFPPTFTVQTGGGGFHYYYICPNQPKVIFENGHEHHLGELQSKGQQVVGPGSIHPNGKPYTVVMDELVKTINQQYISLLPQKQHKEFTPLENIREQLRITDVVPLAGLTQKPSGELQGAHPIHGKTTNTPGPCSNFTVNPSKNVWYCFAHNIGGGPLEWIAQQEGILGCGDTLSKQDFKKVIEVAREKYGLPSPVEDVLPEEITPEIIEELLKEDKAKEARSKTALKLVDEHLFLTLSDTRETLVYKDGYYQSRAESFIESEIRNLWGSNTTKFVINEIIGAHIKPLTYVERETFNEDKNITCLKNGLFNLRTKELIPFNPDIKFNFQLPITYNPDATCPNINAFLANVVDEDDINLVLEIIGYCLYRDYPIQKAIMLVGDASNGKSTLIKLITAFLGKENTSGIALQDLVQNRFAAAQLYGKHANLYPDLSDKSLKQTGLFKMVTGGDMIHAEKKFKDGFEFYNYAKLIYSANKLPEVSDTTSAFFRRWVIINFPNTFDDDVADKDIIDRLTTKEELSGLFNRVTDALVRLLNDGRFVKSPSTGELEDRYTKLSNSIAAFASEVIEYNPDGEGLTRSELFNVYAEYCRRNDLIVKSQTMFSKELKNYIHLNEVKIGGSRGWGGIIFLKPEFRLAKDKNIMDSTKNLGGYTEDT